MSIVPTSKIAALYPANRRMVLRLRRQNHHHAVAVERWHRLDRHDVGGVVCHAFQQHARDFRMLHLTATEADADTHLGAFLGEFANTRDDNIDIMVVGLGAETQFLDFDLLLRLARFAFPFLFFVKLLAVVHQSTNGRIGIGRNLYEIQLPLCRQCQRFACRQNAELLTGFVDHPHTRCTNL